jgi:hypothetical protein
MTHFGARGTGLTDKAIAHLKCLPILSFADLRDTKITAEGVADLRKAFPDCRILSDYMADDPDR